MEHQIIFAKNGKSFLPIVIPGQASDVEKMAANELSEYLQKVSGASFCVISEPTAVKNAIYVGHTNYAKSYGVVCTGEEQWYVKAYNGNLIISGGTQANHRGVLYGVYHFLEDHVGIRWWNEWEEYVPKQAELSMASDLFLEGEPEFKLRQISTRYYRRDWRFNVRNRQHGDIPKEHFFDWDHGHEQARQLGGFVYGGGASMVHSTGLYIPASEYFEEHPDWFAWDEKYQERNCAGQLCFSSEEMAMEMSRKVLAAIKEDSDTAAKLGINQPAFYSISLGDFGAHCQCEKCKKSIEESGLVGHILKFINRIAREVDKYSPGTMLETLAYNEYREPPKDGTVPEKNVYIRLADVYTDILHSLNHKHNTEQKYNVVTWGELCKKNGAPLLIWDYYMYQFPYYPLPMLFKLKENFEVYRNNGVKGIFIESHEDSGNSLWTMQNWLMCKLMEDFRADFNALIDDFVCKYYGPAGESIKKYLYLLHEASEKYAQRVVLHYSTTHTNYIDLDTVLLGNKYLEEALESVKGCKEFTDRVKMLRSNLDAAIAVRYDDFVRMAKNVGARFDLSRSEAADRALEAYDITANTFVYDKKMADDAFLDINIAYCKKTLLAHREETVKTALPAELSHLKAEDVYEIIVPKLLCMDEEDGYFGQQGRGAVNVADAEAIGGIAQRLDYDFMDLSFARRYGFSKKGAAIDNPMKLHVKRTSCMDDPQPYYERDYYLEDLKPNQYALYSLCGIKGVSSDSDYTFAALGSKEITVDLSAISIVLPASEYDIYMRMKFTGPVYGGSEGDANAIYIDRIYVVKVN